MGDVPCSTAREEYIRLRFAGTHVFWIYSCWADLSLLKTREMELKKPEFWLSDILIPKTGDRKEEEGEGELGENA